jgi:hypothetical protein
MVILRNVKIENVESLGQSYVEVSLKPTFCDELIPPKQNFLKFTEAYSW